MAVGVAGLAVLGIMLVAGDGRAPVPIERRLPPAEDAGPATPVASESDADVVLVFGQTSVVTSSAGLPSDAPARLDLVLPVAIDGPDHLTSRVLTLGRDPLELDGSVRGAGRDTIRLEVAPGWLQPGEYLIEIETQEKSHFPLRRFALVVE